MAALERDDFEQEGLLEEAGPPELPPAARTRAAVSAAWLSAASLAASVAGALQPPPEDVTHATQDAQVRHA